MSAYALHVQGDCGDGCAVCGQECDTCCEWLHECTCPDDTEESDA